MKVVSDAGPLMAFAKIGRLETLLRLFPKILTPPAVYAEAVTAGLELQAPDAAILAAEFEAQRLEVSRIRSDDSPFPDHLGLGEEESIRLALEAKPDRLLIDDRAARREAEHRVVAAKLDIRIQGTLGVIVSARLEDAISVDEAVEMVESIERRPDIWIHSSLCEKVRKTLRDS